MLPQQPYQPSAGRHPGCCPGPPAARSAAGSTGLHVSLSVLVSSGYMPSSGTAGSCGSFIPGFKRNLTLFSTVVLSVLAFPSAVQEGPFSPRPLQRLSLAGF